MNLKIFLNPFQAQTTIQYQLPTLGNVTIQLRDFLGRKMSVLANMTYEKAGLKELQFNAEKLYTSTYFVVLNYNG